MIELLLALADEPAAIVQTAPGPLDAQVGAIYVGGGTMMAWNSSRDGLGGQVSVTVINRGTEPDRVVSISTPAGPVGSIKVYAMRDGGNEALPDGDTSIREGHTYVVAELTDIAWGQPAPRRTAMTIVFERAGEVTIDAVPASPAPPPPPRRN